MVSHLWAPKKNVIIFEWWRDRAVLGSIDIDLRKFRLNSYCLHLSLLNAFVLIHLFWFRLAWILLPSIGSPRLKVTMPWFSLEIKICTIRCMLQCSTKIFNLTRIFWIRAKMKSLFEFFNKLIIMSIITIIIPSICSPSRTYKTKWKRRKRETISNGCK